MSSLDWVDSLIACSINTYIIIWSDFEFVIHLACIIKTRILDFIWPCLLIIMIMKWLFFGNIVYLRPCSVIWHYAGENKQYSLKKSCYYYPYGHVPQGDYFQIFFLGARRLSTRSFCWTIVFFRLEFSFFLSTLGLKILMTFFRCYFTQQIVNMQNILLNKKLAYILNILRYFYEVHAYIKKACIFAGADE